MPDVLARPTEHPLVVTAIQRPTISLQGLCFGGTRPGVFSVGQLLGSFLNLQLPRRFLYLLTSMLFRQLPQPTPQPTKAECESVYRTLDCVKLGYEHFFRVVRELRRLANKHADPVEPAWAPETFYHGLSAMFADGPVIIFSNTPGVILPSEREPGPEKCPGRHPYFRQYSAPDAPELRYVINRGQVAGLLQRLTAEEVDQCVQNLAGFLRNPRFSLLAADFDAAPLNWKTNLTVSSPVGVAVSVRSDQPEKRICEGLIVREPSTSGGPSGAGYQKLVRMLQQILRRPRPAPASGHRREFTA